jgi:hypothetical protein
MFPPLPSFPHQGQIRIIFSFLCLNLIRPNVNPSGTISSFGCLTFIKPLFIHIVFDAGLFSNINKECF